MDEFYYLDGEVDDGIRKLFYGEDEADEEDYWMGEKDLTQFIK